MKLSRIVDRAFKTVEMDAKNSGEDYSTLLEKTISIISNDMVKFAMRRM